MKIFSKNFKTIILSLILLGLLAGNSKIFCIENGVEFQVSDEELDDIELSLDDGDGASTIEVEDDSVVVENNDNNEKPKKEISKKRRFFVSLLKVAAIVVPAIIVAFYIGNDLGCGTGEFLGNIRGVRGDMIKVLVYAKRGVEALKGRLRRAQCDKNKEGGGLGGFINEGDYLVLQNKLGEVYGLLGLIMLKGGMYKNIYYRTPHNVVERIRELLGEIREKVEYLAGVGV